MELKMNNEAKMNLLEEISPENFIYELYDSGWRDRFEDYYDFLSVPNYSKIAERAIGFCDASRLQVRPRTDEYAIMCEDDCGKFWFHVTPMMFDGILDAIESKK